MKTGKKLLLGTLAFGASVGLIGATVYAAKPGNCPSIENYNPSGHYNAAYVYGGRSDVRAREAARLYSSGYFENVIPLGTQPEIQTMINTLLENGVSPKSILPPVTTSVDTLTNLQSGNETVRKLSLGNKIAHVSDAGHLPRIQMLNQALSSDLEPNNDGYFPVEGGFGTPIWRLPPLRNSDLAAWYACIRDRRRIN